MNQRRGAQAEALAEDWLSAHGLNPIERNVHMAGGELDLVMRDGDTLVFVEVRHRAEDDWVPAVESISDSKRRRLVRTAQLYLAQLPEEWNGRFDILAIDGALEQGEVTWLRDAFDAD